MSIEPIIYAVDERPESMPVIGVQITVLASATETGGPEFSVQVGEEGMGPPPHSHDWPEAFFVLEGSVLFTCDGIEKECGPGSFVFVPPGTIHAFKFGPGGGKMFESTGLGSKASQLFRELSEQLEPGPPDIPEVARIFDDNDAKLYL